MITLIIYFFPLVISVSWEENQLQMHGKEDSTVPTILVVQGSNLHPVSPTGNQQYK